MMGLAQQLTPAELIIRITFGVINANIMYLVPMSIVQPADTYLIDALIVGR